MSAETHRIDCDMDEACNCDAVQPPVPWSAAAVNERDGLLFAPQLALVGHARPVGACRGEWAVVEMPKAQADELVRRHHYSGSVVWSSSVHLACTIGGAFAGVMQLGPAMNPASGHRVVAESTRDSWLELNRMWIDDAAPPQSASRLLSLVLRYLRAARPAVEWVQSFADERCGKLGAVYQACSFLYLGSHASTFYELDGEWYHKSMIGRPAVDRRGWGCGPKIARFQAHIDRATPHVFRQYRYWKGLRRGVERRLLLPALPYPKPGNEAAA